MPNPLPIEPAPGAIVPSRSILIPREERLSALDIWRVLVKRRYLMIALTLIGLIGSTIYSVRAKPVYESVARIAIDPSQSNSMGLQDIMREQMGEDSAATMLQTEVRILNSDAVILEAAQQLDLKRRLNIGEQKNAAATQAGAAALTPKDRLAMIGAIRGNLHVQVIPQTHLVEIHVRDTDPKLAADVSNALVDAYIERDLRSRYDRTMRISAWLQKQMDELRQQSADAQMRLAQFQKKNNIVGTDENSNLVMQNLQQVSQSLAETEADRILKEAKMRGVESQDGDMVALMGSNPVLSGLRSQLTDLKTQYAQLSSKYGNGHPRIQELKAQIEKVEASITKETENAKRQARQEYLDALRSETMLRKRLDQQKEQAFQLSEDVAQYAILRHEAETNRNLYDALQMRLKEAGVTASLGAMNISILDRAELPVYPVAPNRRLNILLGLLGGFFSGIVCCFLAESIDDTLPTSEEAESVSKLPSLATIPHIQTEELLKRRQSKNDQVTASRFAQEIKLVTLRSPKSNVAEAYRGLRSSLLLSSVDNPPQVIMVTSAFSSEGKSTTSMNVAIALAQRNAKVLLVDADLRRGATGRVFGIKGSNIGLTTLLAHSAPGQEIPSPLPELPTLSVLPSGPRAPNPAELLASNRMAEQLRRWREQYDHIVIDSAPLLAVSDSLALAVQADSVVLVVRARVTRKRALLRARDVLRRINARVAGVVVNDVDLRLEHFYTYRYAGYGYRYGKYYATAMAYGYDDDEQQQKEPTN
jgi:succinoglycan biosynthesis transport protein ExoP